MAHLWLDCKLLEARDQDRTVHSHAVTKQTFSAGVRNLAPIPPPSRFTLKPFFQLESSRELGFMAPAKDPFLEFFPNLHVALLNVYEQFTHLENDQVHRPTNNHCYRHDAVSSGMFLSCLWGFYNIGVLLYVWFSVQLFSLNIFCIIKYF